MTDCTYYAIGDVHGELEKLDELLRLIRADAVLRKVAHRLVFLGDLIDRGPDSRGVVERVMRVEAEGDAVTLLGNHEEMLLNAWKSSDTKLYALWGLNGGDRAIASYERVNGVRHDWRDSVDASHVHWMRALPTLLHDEPRRLVFVHAGIDPTTFPNCDAGVRLWTRSDKFFDPGRWPKRRELEGLLVVHGHTPTHDFAPHVNPRRINIDTGACFGGPLTCVVLAPGEAPRFLFA
jgi:serine/threonine protein phosphatase 1